MPKSSRRKKQNKSAESMKPQLSAHEMNEMLASDSLAPQKPELIVGLRKSLANTQGNNPKDRYGLSKVPFSLIPQPAKVLMAMGLSIGAEKYGPYNWRVEPVQGRIYLEAAERHLNLLLDGEDFDRDTGIHHGAFVLSTIAIYIDAMVHGTLIDNRPLAGRTGDLVAFFNRIPGQSRTKDELQEGFKQLLAPIRHQIVTADNFIVETDDSGRVKKVLGKVAKPTTKRTPVKRSVRKGARNARR